MSDRYGNVKASTILRDINRVRDAVRTHDADATECAWDKLERWLGVFPDLDVQSRIDQLEAAIAKADALADAFESSGNVTDRHARACHALVAYRETRK